MALRFADSFDHYVTADLPQKWTTVENGPVISAANGRRSTAALRMSSLNALRVTKTLDAQATWIVGFSFRASAISPVVGMAFLGLLDASSIQIDVRINADGTLAVTRNGTVLSTSVFALSATVVYYIEFKATIGNAGSYELRVNGATVTSGSGVDTQATANASANQVRLGNGGTGSGITNADYDDLYICDGTGSANNDFLGDVRVDCYLPNANGNSSQLIGSDGNSTDNYLLVDEAAPNGDTDYVQSATVAQKDTYTFPNMTHTPTAILGVQVVMNAKKDDSGLRSIASVTRSGGSDTDGTTKALASSYTVYLQILENDPNTAAAWTQSGFDSAEFGVKVAA